MLKTNRTENHTNVPLPLYDTGDKVRRPVLSAAMGIQAYPRAAGEHVEGHHPEGGESGRMKQNCTYVSHMTQ